MSSCLFHTDRQIYLYERICWCSIFIYILMLDYGSEWVCWCFQNRWLNLSMARLIGRYSVSWCIWEVLWNKKRKSSTRTETQNRRDKSIFQLPFGGNCHVTTVGRHLLSKIHERCRNCRGNIPIMVRSQKCNLYSAWTKKRGRESNNQKYRRPEICFHEGLVTFLLSLNQAFFFLEALMIGFLWGFEDSKWRFRFDPMLLLFLAISLFTFGSQWVVFFSTINVRR